MHKLNNPCIKTGEFAQLCNTNKRTLFYYDEIGLFSPTYTDKNGYRYYSENQCDVFFTISCLRDLGMPLKEIKEYITHRNPDKLKEILTEQHNKIQTEQERLRWMDQVILTKLSLVDLSKSLELQNSLSSVTLEDLPEEYFIVSPRIDTDDHDIIVRTIYEHIGYLSHHHLNCGHPYGAIQPCSALLEGRFDYYAYFCTRVMGIQGEEAKSDSRHPYFIKPAGKYAVTYLTGDYYDSEKAYQRIFDFVKKNELKLGDFSYKEAVLDEIAVKTEDEYLTKISIKAD